MTSYHLHQAIEYLKAGRVDDARHMLRQIVKAEPHNVNAWMWYVETLPALEKKIEALENCVILNPNDKLAVKALRTLKGNLPEAAPPEAEHPVQAEPLAKPVEEAPPRAEASSRSRRGRGYTGKGLTRKKKIGIAIFIAEMILLYAIGLWLTVRAKPNENILAVGEKAVSEQVTVAIQRPIEMDGRRKGELYVLREVTANRYPKLLAGEYRPSDEVFGQIENDRPWWGLAGQFYYGPGEKSIVGLSEESRFFTNPYMLVAAEPYLNWYGRVPEAIILKPDFEFYCAPRRLQWYPTKSQAYLTYNADCAARMDYYEIHLIAYNARDLNLKYIYVSYADSLNVTKSSKPQAAIEIPQYIHEGDSCGYPRGCNNMSPATPELNGLLITGYPAQIAVWLWEEKPSSVQQTPDMTYIIRFE